MLAEHFFDEHSRCADIGDVELAGVFGGAGGEEAGFGGDEGAGVRGADRGMAGLPVSQSRPLGKSTARIGLPAALMASITRSSGGRGSPWLPVPSKASIIQAAPDIAAARSAAIGSPAKIANRHAGFFQHAKIGGRIAGQTRRVGKQKHLDRHLPQIEVPGGDETVAAVVAFAATDHRPPAVGELAEQIRYAPARILHQHQTAQAVF